MKLDFFHMSLSQGMLVHLYRLQSCQKQTFFENWGHFSPAALNRSCSIPLIVHRLLDKACQCQCNYKLSIRKYTTTSIHDAHYLFVIEEVILSLCSDSTCYRIFIKIM